MELFDIVKNIFSKNQRSWDSVGKNDKVRNFFMINRIMSIQFPVQANQFNKMRVNPHFVVDWWRNTLSNRFSKPPSWIYTKTVKRKLLGKRQNRQIIVRLKILFVIDIKYQGEIFLRLKNFILINITIG